MAAEAESRKAGAEICDLRHVKEFSVSLGDVRQLRNPQTNKVYRHVRLLQCHAKVAGGIGEIDRWIEMAAQENGGPLGEVQCLSVALKEFLTAVENAITSTLKRQAAPADPQAPPPLPSYRTGKDPVKAARMQALNARRAAEQEQPQVAALDGPDEGGEA